MSSASYENFDILILPVSDGYQARVISSPAGQARTNFKMPFSAAELRTLTWLATQSLRHLRPVAPNEPPTATLDPKLFGERLFQAVFADPLDKLLVRSYDLAKAQGHGLRIRLRVDQDAPELAELPWEYLYVADWSTFPALSDQTPIVRYLELDQPERLLPAKLPLRILTVVANPNDAPQLQVEQEWTRLQTAVADLQTGERIELERLSSPTLAALQNRLREIDIHILHFIGHGRFDPVHNEGCLLFENENGAGQLVSADKLATLLRDEGLRLVFLNACEGARNGENDSFAGVAAKLVQQGIPAVLAMQFAVSDQAALTLAHEFYSAIADNYPVDAAVSEARKKIYVAGNEQEWATPVLFMRSPDGRLFGLDQADTSAWHFAGSLWLAMLGVTLVLLVGLGYLLLEPWPLLRNSIAVMGAVLSGLLGFFGVRGDQIPIRQFSYQVGVRRSVQAGIGGLLAVTLILWGTVGRAYFVRSACTPLPCPPPGVRYFAIGAWKSLTPGASPYEGVWTDGTRRTLYEKLSRIPALKGIALDSPQVAADVSQQIDLWIQGGFQKISTIQLSADVTERGGIRGQTVSVRRQIDEQDAGIETQILALQNQLASEILATLQITPTQDVLDAIQQTPTSNGEALRLNNLAADLIAQGDLTTAEKVLNEAIALDPRYASPHINLGRIRFVQGDWAGAVAEYQTAIGLLPTQPLYYYNLGSAYERLGDNQAAIAAYQKAIALDPGYAAAFNNLGFTYLQTQQLTSAQEILQQGLRLDATSPYLHKNLGRLYLAQAKPAEAVVEFQQALDLRKDQPYPEALYYLAVARQTLGKTTEACTALQQYASVSASDSPERITAAATLTVTLQCR